tara:strand:- start:705 stop:1532 length:828 start_codon:yes stop_codon:yes gene_type:complete
LFTFIDSHENLDFLNKELLSKTYIGVDTEFRRTTKDNMKLALLQINDDEEIFLIDTILIEEPAEQVSFLFSDSIVKIFHSCKEDLEAVYSWTDRKIENIFDTQLANSFLDSEFSISYQALVEKKLGIVLDKRETRSNWIRRPLSDAQLKYAALDVEYLIPIYLEQCLELSKSEKLNWLKQDINMLVKNTFNQSSTLDVLKRVISKSEEDNILSLMNKRFLKIAQSVEINPTMFFSKKAQKEFLRLALSEGVNKACEEITEWRELLVREELMDILK